jgi:WD40 repeat protein/transcriptional regulator with XRE-family HTH domain
MSDHSSSGDGVPDPDRIATQQDFGRALTLLRNRAGLTVRQVARASGLPASTVGDYFSGRHLPATGQAGSLHRILAACGESDPARLTAWTDALGRARRQPGNRMALRGGGEVPYRGLASFEREDAPWFFGREQVIKRLFDFDLGAGLPLIVVGPSGSGKSSLLRAGLMAQLTGPVALFVPTATPAADFAAVVADLSGPAGAAEPLGSSGSEPPCAIVDQFEAVFTRCQDEEQREAFISAVGELAETATVILALRADFYDQALRYPVLAAALQARQVVLGPMTADQVRRAIVEPARRAHLEVEDGLVELLLRDLEPRTPHARRPGGPEQGAHEPGALPLLSHALLSTWEHSSTGTITVADYLASGGISDAITRTAEGVFGRLSADQQQMARRLFLRLVHVADDAPPTRRAVRLTELTPLGGQDTEELLGRFVDERLITVDADTVQITHDALLTAWPRLRSWIDTGQDDLRTRRRITEASRVWQENDQDSSALPRGLQLAIFAGWNADPDNRDSLGPLASRFLTAAIAEEQARERAERHRTRRLRRLVGALTVLVVVVVGLAGYSFQQRTAAATARDDADSREVAVMAGQLRDADVPLAAQLSVAAYRIARTPEADASLLESSGTPSAAQLTDSPSLVQAVSLSPSHTLMAVAAADGTLRLWDVASPSHPARVGDPLINYRGRALYTTAISPDGKILAAAGADKTVSLWNITDPDHPVPLGKPLTGPASTVYSVAFSPDGLIMAAGSADDTVRLWNLADPLAPKPLATLRGPAGYVESVAFSPSGRVLAAGSADNTVRLWNVADPSRPAALGRPLTGPANIVTSVTFSPNGRILAAGSQDDKVWLWNVGTPAKAIPLGALTGATDWVNAVSFSPNGQTVAAGSSQNCVLVWNLASRSLTAQLPQEDPVTSVAWDGDGRLAAGDADGTVSFWSLPSPILLAGAPVNSVAFSPDDSMLAVGSQHLQLWDPASRSLLASLPTPSTTFVNAVAFAPGGRLVAAGYGNGTFQLWRTTGKVPVPLGPELTASNSGMIESVSFNPDGKILATGGDDGTVRLWSVPPPGSARARAVRLATEPDSGSYVFSVAFSPDGQTLAAASADGLTRLWSVRDPARPVPLGPPLTGPASYAYSVAFSPDGNLLAVGSADKTVRLWSVRDPARPAPLGPPLTGPASYVYSVAFSPDGKALAAGVTDGTVWLWNLAVPARPSLVATITGPNGHVYSVAFSHSGQVVAAGSADGTVRLWDTSAAQAASAVCANEGQPLSRSAWDTSVPGVTYRVPCS